MITPHIPERFEQAIAHWIFYALRPGSFLTNVLMNDLAGAIGAADAHSLVELPGIVCWLYNEAPRECWGSRERVANWRGTHQHDA